MVYDLLGLNRGEGGAEESADAGVEVSQPDGFLPVNPGLDGLENKNGIPCVVQNKMIAEKQ
jgi:hypothetical protein